MKKTSLLISDKGYVRRADYDSLNSTIKRKISALLTKKIRAMDKCEAYTSGLPCKIRKEKGDLYCKKCDMTLFTLKCYYITKNFFIFDIGNKEVLDKIVDYINAKIIDKRVYFKLDESKRYFIDYSLLEEPRKSIQKNIVKKWIKNKYGQIKAPPRLGKTAIAAILSSKSKTRVAIIIHKRELLLQFYNSFLKFSNIKEDFIKINPSVEDVENLSVAIYSWQQFISKKGIRRLSKLRDKFGFIIIDESHKSAAEVYSSRISRFKAKYRLGLSATPIREDGLSFRQEMILGPVTVVSKGLKKIEAEWKVINTNCIFPRYKQMNYRTWNYLWNWIAKNDQRNENIIEDVLKQIKNNHKVIIPIKRIIHANILYDSFKDKGINIICITGKTDNRDKIKEEVYNGKYDVIIGTNSILSLGLDVPPMSCIYIGVGGPYSNPKNFYQEYSRVLTPFEGKNTPLINILNDSSIFSRSMYRMVVTELSNYKKLETEEW